MSEFYADEEDWFVKPRPIEPKEPRNIDTAIKMHEERLEFLKENWFTEERWIEFKEPRNIDMAIKLHEERLKFLKKAKERGCKKFNDVNSQLSNNVVNY